MTQLTHTLGVIFLFTGIVCLGWGRLLLIRLKSSVEEAAQEPAAGTLGLAEARRRYRTLFPEGNLIYESNLLFAAAFFFMFAGLLALQWIHLPGSR